MRQSNDRTGWLGIALGYVIVYHPGVANFCPGCSCGHWHVGRQTAECANCSTALSIAIPGDGLDVLANEGWAARAIRPARIFWRALLPMIRMRPPVLHSH